MKTRAKITNKEGITVKPFGQTPNSRLKSKCGTDAIRNFVGPNVPSRIQSYGRYFQPYMRQLKKKGYRFGLTV